MKNALRMAQLMKHINFNYLAGDGSTHKIENPPYMPLLITAAAPKRVYVAHVRIQNGDMVYDPEIEFYVIHPEWSKKELWMPYAIHQPGMMINGRVIGGYKVYAEFENGKPARYHTRQQADLARFANFWATNIRRQGFLEA